MITQEAMKNIIPSDGMNIIEWLRLSAIKSGQSEYAAMITAQNTCRNLGFDETDIVHKGSENEG